MPRASWKGFLRLSLVTCPVYLEPATTESKRIHLNQLNRLTGNRIRQRLVDEGTGDEVTRDAIVKGYEHAKDEYVQISDDDLATLRVESDKTIDLESFVPVATVDRLYLDSAYHVHPDGKMGEEAYRVIVAALTRVGLAGLGRVTMGGREQQVLVETRGVGLVMTKLRAADEVRPGAESDVGVDMEYVALAEAVICKRVGAWDPSCFHDRYQEALHALITAKVNGKAIAPKAPPAPPPQPSLMDALRASLAREADVSRAVAVPSGPRRRRKA